MKMEKKDIIIVSNLDSNNSSNLLFIENYLAEWEKICVDFFNHGNKIDRDVIKLVENSKITNGDIKIDFSVIEEGTTTTIAEKEEVENILTKIGFINGILVHSQNFNKYIETKRKARSDWHKQKVIELTQELDALLHRQPAQYTPPHRRSELSGYINQYKNSIGAKPFIKGLLKVFQLQLTKLSLISWTFLDDSLTQNGADFMRATVNLLVNVLGFTHTIQEVDESGEQRGNSSRTWYVSGTLTDKEISSLLELFPKEKSSTLGSVNITGTIEISSQPRSSRMIRSSPITITGIIFLPLKFFSLWIRFFKWCILLCYSIFPMKSDNRRENTLSEIRV